jgi:hypothetical protein
MAWVHLREMRRARGEDLIPERHFKRKNRWACPRRLTLMSYTIGYSINIPVWPNHTYPATSAARAVGQITVPA